MTEIELLIKISKEKYDMIKNKTYCGIYDAEVYKAIANGTPRSKTGRWIPLGYNGYADGHPVYDWWECSECGWEHAGDEETLTPYCPNCGAKMEEEE